MNESTSRGASPLTIYRARRIVTMEPSLPRATAVAVADGRVVAVGDPEEMAPWTAGRAHHVDDRFADHVLVPGLVDNHVHPWLLAVLLPCAIVAPEPWRLPDGEVAAPAIGRDDYRAKLAAAIAARAAEEIVVSWGWQSTFHGPLVRADLDRMAPDRAVVVLQRSFHEVVASSAALAHLGLGPDDCVHPQVRWHDGHFFETGRQVLMSRLMPRLRRPDWYERGLGMAARLLHQGGVTCGADMAFGIVDVDFERETFRRAIGDPGLPLRMAAVLDARSLGWRLAGSRPSPDAPADFAGVLALGERLRATNTPRFRFLKAAKLFADGAMFSQLMRLRPPGYTDGHEGEWIMSPELLARGVDAFWHAGWQLHIHVNGDAGMDAVLDALERAMAYAPRRDHRFTLHHVGVSSSEQARRAGALGACASVNPYYVHALADAYSALGLGPERASQMVRAASLRAAGVPVSLHSDALMAPPEPLFLAWCAATRTTRSGRVAGAHECLALDAALRAVTIDAAHALRMDDEIGSIAAGKRADFTVLDRDPFESGAEGLRDVRVVATVLDGEAYPLAAPCASAFASLAPGALAPPPRPAWRARWRSLDGCEDRCGDVRTLARWLAGALGAPAPSAVSTGGAGAA